jgi:hypothetical protein
MSESLGLPWTPEELEIVEEAFDYIEAVQEYRLRFGNVRTFAAIVACWYRNHPRIPRMLTLQERGEENEILNKQERDLK